MSSASYVYTPIERTSRRLGLFLLIVIGLMLTMALFFVKTNAQDARETVAQLEAQIVEHETAIAVLIAEQAVLANPERLRRLSGEKLSLEPIQGETVSTLSELSQVSDEATP